MRAPDSHGDIVVWPIKALCDYIETTGDLSILDERVGSADDPGVDEPLDRPRTAPVDRIESRFAPRTALLRFGNGDCGGHPPAGRSARAERLVSSWTVELAYETLGRFRVALQRRAGPVDMALATRLADLCSRIRADFNRLLVPDGDRRRARRAGGGWPEPLLHPLDRRTGVHYRPDPDDPRLISGMFTPAQAAAHDARRRHLSFPMACG